MLSNKTEFNKEWKEYSLEEYYNRFIQNDIKKCAAHLDELAAKKEEVYSK